MMAESMNPTIINSISEPSRSIPVLLDCDVLVAGGGIAGIAAAVAAARGGKNVLLVEREYGLGGMATLGLVTIYLPLCDGEGTQVVYGLGEELLKLSIKYGAEANYPEAWIERASHTSEERIRNRYVAQFNPHMFALEAEALLKSLGVRILYGTVVVATPCEGGRVTSAVCENKSGRFAVSLGSIIDATGDADVCHLAGAPTELHQGGNGLASWYYYFDGSEVKLKMFGLADFVPESKPKSSGSDTCYDAVMVEALDRSFRFSGVDGLELSDAVLAAHEKMFDDIKEQHARDPRWVPTVISSIPLVRMSRRLVGAYTMDESESRRHTYDSIGMTGDWRKRGPAFEIPFSCLYTPGVRNLLAAGRDISVTDAMWDITRVIPPCAVTGEAAGTAASLSCDFPSLDVSLLQDALRRNGQRLHLEEV